MMRNKPKLGIIGGAGHVGATLAYTLALKGMCSDIVLHDIQEERLMGTVLDISQSVSSDVTVKATSSYEDLEGLDIIVITAGMARKPTMTREDLLLSNASIMKNITLQLSQYVGDAIVIIVSNPLDAMVYLACHYLSIPSHRVIGMAGILDTARMNHFIAKQFSNDAVIESLVIGGHGDDMVPLINLTTVNNTPLQEVLTQKEIENIVTQTREGGKQIVGYLKNSSAYYAPAYSIYLMIDAIINNRDKVYSCSVLLEGEYGYKDLVIGVPVVLDSQGIKTIIQLPLTLEQQANFDQSAKRIGSLLTVIKEKFN